MKVFSIAAILASAAFVAAQNATFPCITESEIDVQVPACAKACQQAAVRSDGCDDYEDAGCHCYLKTGYIQSLIEPCLANSTCTQDEVNAFAAIVQPICAYLNGTLDGTIPKPYCPSPSAKPSSCKSKPAGKSPYPHTYTSWAVPTSTWAPQPTGGYYNATPSAPVQFYGAAPSTKTIGSGLLALAGGVAAYLL